jgi:predicted dehydrogenase
MKDGRINVGIIGVHPEKGWASTAHIPALQQLPQFNISGISHSRADIAKAAALKFGANHAFASADAMVCHPEIDLVVVAVKVLDHSELVSQAVAAGKAVFSEWPLAVDLEEASSLRDLAAGKGVRTAIGLQTRAVPVMAYIRDLVREGYVGRVLSATIIGSGMVWGETISEGSLYTLDPKTAQRC